MSKKNETAITKSEPVNYELSSARQIEQLTVELAQREIWPDAPEEEVRKAVHIAQARGANPWCSEIYLISRNEKKPDGSYKKRWVIQMSQNYVLKVAASHPACAGWQDGVIVQDKDGNIAQLEGSFIPKGWTLTGAWCKAYRKGFQVPVVKRVNLEEYDTGKSTWNKLKPTMIVKVARVQALREILPDRLSGMYDAAEMDQMGEAITMITDGSPPPALPAASPNATPPPNNKPKNAPAPTGKDEEHLKELIGIIMTLAEGDKDQAKEILKDWSSFPDSKTGKAVFIESFHDPRLKAKWLNRLVAKGRESHPEIAEAVKAKLEEAESQQQPTETVEGEVVEPIQGELIPPESE